MVPMAVDFIGRNAGVLGITRLPFRAFVSDDSDYTYRLTAQSTGPIKKPYCESGQFSLRPAGTVAGAAGKMSES